MLIVQSGCGSNSVTKQVYSMDTIMTLTVYGRKANDAILSSVNVINTLEKQLNPTSKTSEVTYINNLEGKSRSVSTEIVEMLELSKTIYKNSNGAFDPTIYSLSCLWGFMSLNSSNVSVPTDEEIAEELTKVDFSKVNINDNIISMPEDMQLSFNAIAKGYCSNKIVATLRNMGVKSAIISLGGNIQTIGLKPNGDKWTVAIEDPDSVGNYIGTLDVGETAVVTSGGYQKAFIDNGVTYTHILDPKTGYPVDSGLKSVTIVCRDGALADALSTALYVLGKDSATEYWRQYGGFEMIMVSDDNRVYCTDGLKDIFNSLSASKYPVTFIN